MELQIAGTNLEIPPATQEYIERKLGKLNKHIPDIIDIKVEVSEEKTKSPEARYLIRGTVNSGVGRAVVHGEERVAVNGQTDGMLDPGQFEVLDAAKLTFIDDTMNDAPVAVDDQATTDEGIAVTINVIANDSDPNGLIDPTSVVVVTNPAHGSVIIEVPESARRHGSMLELAGICQAVNVEIPITPGQARMVLDASSLASGSYLVLIFNDHKLVGSGKLIVE